MGAIVSKLCFTCCTGHRTRKTNTATNSQSKLSKIPSLIIERTQVLREVDEGTEYSRILERDFEIKGRSGSSKRSQLNNVESSNLNRSDSTIKAFQVKHKESGHLFTLTRIKKSSLTEESAESLCREIRLLAGELPNHPMLVNLYWTWQDEKYLYRVDDDIMNEEAVDVNLEKLASQLAIVIHYIHSYGMIHGNINPNSFHITANSIKIGSFGYLRKVKGGKRLNGVCGDLTEFRAPECEIEEGEGYFEEIDWYSYGKTLEYYFKNHKTLPPSSSLHLQDLISKLTKDHPKEDRLGYGPAGFKSIQSHPFFSQTDWPHLLTQKTDQADRKKYGSLSASIESLKSKTTTMTGSDEGCGWRGFVEFSWEEEGEIGQMLESIIKRI